MHAEQAHRHIWEAQSVRCDVACAIRDSAGTYEVWLMSSCVATEFPLHETASDSNNLGGLNSMTNSTANPRIKKRKIIVLPSLPAWNPLSSGHGNGSSDKSLLSKDETNYTPSSPLVPSLDASHSTHASKVASKEQATSVPATQRWATQDKGVMNVAQHTKETASIGSPGVSL